MPDAPTRARPALATAAIELMIDFFDDTDGPWVEIRGAATDQLAALTARIAELEHAVDLYRLEQQLRSDDAERIEYCVRNYLAADFDYGEPSECVLVVKIPQTTRINNDFRFSIDGARAVEEGHDG